MIVLSTQIKPLLDRMRTAVPCFLQSAAIRLVIYAHLFACAVVKIVPVAGRTQFVYSMIHALLYISWSAVVFAKITRAYLFSIAWVCAMPMLVIARAYLTDWAAAIGTPRRLVVVGQRLLNTASGAYLRVSQLDLRGGLLQLGNIARTPIGLIGFDARFAAISMPVAAAFIFVELVEGLVGTAPSTAFGIHMFPFRRHAFIIPYFYPHRITMR